MNNDVSVSGNHRLWNRISRLLADEKTGSQIYLFAFAFFMCDAALGTTMFEIPGGFYLFCKGFALLLVIVKIILFDRYKPAQFWAVVFLIAAGGVVYLSSGFTEPLLWICMVVGAKNVPFRKILQVYLIVSVGVVLLAFCASMLDVITNLQYTVSDELFVRNSFGIIYTTDFASHIFSIVLVSLYLLKDRLKIYHYIVCLVLAALVYIFCHTRLDVVCIVLLIAAFAAVSIWKKYRALPGKYRRETKAHPIWCWTMPICAALMIIATALYSDQNRLLYRLDQLLTSRLTYGKECLTKFGITIFGQQIEMVGHGRSTLDVKDYLFADCSYLYVMLQYGVLFLLIILAIYVMCCRKYQKDFYFLAAVLVISINCMIAHHLMEMAYSPFVLALFAAAPGISSSGGKLSLWERSSG